MFHRIVAAVSVCALAAASPAFAGAVSGVYATAQTSIPSGPDGYDYHGASTGPVSSVTRSDDIIGLGTYSSASAMADFGDLHAYGFSNGGVSGILQNASAESGWFDQVTVLGVGQVLMTFTFTLDGTLEQHLAGPFFPASVGALAGNVGSESDYEGFQQLASPTSTPVSASVTLGPFVVDTNVPTNITMRLIAYVNGVGVADFSSTAHFTGAGVTDLSGVPLSSTIVAASGFDYSIPAPGAIPIFAIAALAPVRRRR